MEQKKILSLLLLMLMLVSIVRPIGAFAEEEVQEPVYEEPAYEEPVYEEPVYEDAETETLVEEMLVADETVQQEEQLVEEVLVEDEVVAMATALLIRTQPVNARANIGEAASFTVVASGVSGYQWQYSKTGTGTWKNCGEASATSATFEIASVAESNKALYFRCKLTGTDGTTQYTDVVSIEDNGLIIKTQPVNAKANIGEAASFTVTASGVSGYQWQYSKTGTGTWKNCGEASAKSATFEITSVAESNKALYFRCKLTGTDGTTQYTDVVVIEDNILVIDDVTYEPITASTCRVKSYSGSATELVIPQSVKGMTVKEIGEEAFMNNITLTSIDLPDTIEVIRARAFKGCTSLQSMS